MYGLWGFARHKAYMYIYLSLDLDLFLAILFEHINIKKFDYTTKQS
jgi:hypothetical protein